jgi:hypothetical protein
VPSGESKKKCINQINETVDRILGFNFFPIDPSVLSQWGCQMVYFQTKNPNLGKFWSVFQ